MQKIIALSALTILVAGCPAKDAPVESAVPAEAEAAAPAEAEAPAPASVATAAADIQWALFNPEQPDGPQLSPIAGNMKEGAFTALVKLPAGHASPLHTHPASFIGVGLTGTIQNGRSAEDNSTITVGTTWTEPANEVHFTGCTEEAECTFVAYMDGAIGMTAAEAAAEGEMAMTVMAAADLAWEPINPEAPDGPQMVVVGGDKATGPFQALVQFPGGAASPPHSHKASYGGAVVSGTMGDGGDVTYGAGSTWTHIADEVHVTACVSEEPCLFFASMDGAFSMVPAEEPAEAPAEAAEEAPAE